MADTSRLKALLDSRGLLPEEIDLWMNLGFYVPAEQINLPGYTTKGSFYTSEGKQWHIPIEVAIPLRIAIVKFLRPAKIHTAEPLDELEIERG